MASYFDPQAPSKVTAEVLIEPPTEDLSSDEDENPRNFLTPQVSRILEGLGEHSSSDDDDVNSSDDTSSPQDGPDKETPDFRKDTNQGASLLKSKLPSMPEKSSPLKSQLSSIPESKKSKHLAPPSTPGVGMHSDKKNHPHLSRFHSLRSMLFASHIEHEHAKQKEAEAKEEAEAKWKADYEQRKCLNRPKTPESPKKSPSRDGFTRRLTSTLRRMTSKEGPSTKDTKGEDSTASSESSSLSEESDYLRTREQEQEIAGSLSGAESLGNSDVEDLVRWVSRRERSNDATSNERDTDEQETGNRHGSLGNSDVEELVRWVSQKGENASESDVDKDIEEVSTASDEEDEETEQESLAPDDIDGLVRWVSRKDSNPGPVREKKLDQILSDLGSDGEAEDALEKQTTLKNDARDISIPAGLNQEATKGHGSLAPQDVDELVEWVGRKSSSTGRSDPEAPAIPAHGAEERERETEKGSLASEDVDDLLQWVSRKGNDTERPKIEGDSRVIEEENRGRRIDDGDLPPLEREEHVRWMSRE